MPTPALAIDTSERIVAANRDVCDLFGQGTLGRNYVTILRQPGLIKTIEAVLADNKPRLSHYRSTDGVDDTAFQVTVRFIPTAQAILLTFTDVTHLEQVGQLRRDFVANVSHELRTPLTALMGFIETLRGPAREDPTARDRFLNIMQDEAGRMNRLVGDLLSLSRVEGEQRVRPREIVNLTDILSSAVTSLTPLSNEQGVVLDKAYPATALEVPGDRDQLIQVFTNLIENGIKYGEAGGRVVIGLEVSDRDSSLRSPAVRVEITDDGPGIDDVHLPRLTERFYRADNHRSRAMGGTGLGLAIVKHIINRHRGRLRIDSTLGEGSKFTVILPRDAT